MPHPSAAYPEHIGPGVRDDVSAALLGPDCRFAGLGSQGGPEAASARKLSSRHPCGGARWPARRGTKNDGVGLRSLTPDHPRTPFASDRPSDHPRHVRAGQEGRSNRARLTGRVPSAKTLAQTYEVATGTAERALALLREAGLIESAMGRGHFVIKRG
jgi:hypothetical protein